MLEFNNYFSNKTIVNQDIYSEEQRKLMNILLNEIKKAENVSQKNKPKLLKELNQERILNWFFKLNLEDKIKVSTITNKWLSHILLELSPLFKKENEMIFVPKKEMLMIFTGEIRNSYENNEIDNDKKLYEKYFICINKMESKDNEAKIDNDLENKFLGKYLNIISSDSNTITLSEELLSDSKEFKRLFRFLSNDKFFTETLSPKKENKNFSLPSWMFKAMNNLTLSQIIIGFIEQNILLNYELFYYTKRIYQSITQNTIVEIYEEINNIDKQISNESFYFENIISQDKFEEATKNISINQESKIGMFNEIKNYIIESKSEEGKINKLLKKLTFLNFKEVNEDRISIYDSYKRFILDLIRSIIAKELIIEDTKILKSKTNNKKNKKKKGKKNKEIKENENNKKKEKEENEEKKQNKDINIGSQNVTNEEKKNEVNEKEVNEQKSKKIKNFILFPVNPIKKEKKKSKKKKQNKKSSKKVDINNTNNHINLNEELIRISSMTSISTYKSSNYQQDLSSNDDSSSISDITPNEFTNLSNNNIINNNTINFISKNNDSNGIDMNNRINNNNCNKINYNINVNNKNKNKGDNSININNKQYNKNYCNNRNNNYQKNTINNFNYNFHLYYYYKIGIDNYTSFINTNLAILNKLKAKNLEIIYNIIKTNLNSKYLLIFGEYGSYATDLSIEGSDIDVCIFYKKLINDNLIFREELYDILKKNEIQKEFTYKTENIFEASIPRIIVKIMINKEIEKNINNFGNLLDNDDMNIIKIDFTFSEKKEYLISNMKSVEYIKNQLILFPQIKPVIQILKRFLKRQKMNEVYTGGISSYALFLLVLNCIKMLKILNPFITIDNSHLMIEVFRKFSFFAFKKNEIRQDNLDSCLGFENMECIPYIINPLTGINVCQVGRCKGYDINNTFYKGYDKLVKEINSFRNIFSCRINPFLINKPIDSIVNLLR